MSSLTNKDISQAGKIGNLIYEYFTYYGVFPETKQHLDEFTSFFEDNKMTQNTNEMAVMDYLQTHTLEQLKEEFSIKVSQNPLYPDLYVLNYNQIESQKTHLIVKECRSLVLGSLNGEDFFVVSRSFDRFFNYNEDGYSPNMEDLVCHEKIDGSLIGVFFYKGEWLYRTKSMIMPELTVNGFDVTWKDFIEEGLMWENLKQGLSDDQYCFDTTYIFEIVGRANRIVVNYTETKCYFLAARNNLTGGYEDNLGGKYLRPKTYAFSSTEDCMSMVRELPNLEEGYVAYDELGVPRVKIKSPAYVAAHRLRGNGLTPLRIAEMVVSNEYDEYLSIFKEDKQYFTPYINTWQDLLLDLYNEEVSTCCVVDKKEFALLVKDLPFSAVLFQFKNNNHTEIKQTMNLQNTSYKVKLLLSEHNKGEV